MKKSNEAAWKVVNEHRELFDSISKEFAVEIIASAIREQVREALEETKSKILEIKPIGGDPIQRLGFALGLDCAIEAIRKMKEKVE